MSYLGINNMGLISWYRDVWYRYFYGMNYDEYIKYEEEPKTYVDVNGREYDMDKYDFVKDWEIRRVARKLENYNANKRTFGDKLREKTEQNRGKVESSENKRIDYMYSKIEDMLMEEASQGRYSKSITGSEFEEIFGFQLLIGSSSPTSFWGRLKKKCNNNGFDIEHDGRLDVYRFNWGKEKPEAFGDELREITKENQGRVSNKAAAEAQIIFDVISKDFIKQSQEGYSSIYYNDKEFEDIMTNNHIATYTWRIWKELKKICKRNKIHAYVDDGLYPIVCYYRFEWK